jgi:hydroxyacylglutathione hydrolase
MHAADPMSQDLYLRQLELGPMQNFVYLIGDPVTRDCVVVDPAWEIDAILETAARDDMNLRAALVTHTHQDHVGGHLFGFDIPGVADLLERARVKVYVHKAERDFLRGLGSDLMTVDGGDTLPVGGRALTFLISGDTLFIQSCGRTDLPGSDPGAMYTSLTQRLGALPDETVVYPGHNYGGESTTIGAEKRHNPMMRFRSMSDFLRQMGRA